MLIDNFKKEITTLKSFFEIYCKNHSNKTTINIYYNTTKIDEIELCENCKEIFLYTADRLKECKESPKPRCRKCKNNCYSKDKYKRLAKIMAYSGIKRLFSLGNKK
jgi:uncharacterized paraquat-inducible protein A